MSIQIFQILHIGAFLLAALAIWKSDKKWVRWFAAIFILVAFFINPIKLTNKNMAPVEAGLNRFNKLPEKVIVEKVPFEERQDEALSKLKQESENQND